MEALRRVPWPVREVASAEPAPLFFEGERSEFLWGPFAERVFYDARVLRAHYEPIEDEV